MDTLFGLGHTREIFNVAHRHKKYTVEKEKWLYTVYNAGTVLVNLVYMILLKFPC